MALPTSSLKSILRGQAPSSEWASSLSINSLIGLIVLCGAIYGACMGGYSAVGGVRILQSLFSATKVPLLLIITFSLSLPSFFIFNSLNGLRDDFKEVLRSLLAAQAGQMVLLASLAPYVILWNFSVNGHVPTILFNAALFGISAFGGQLMLRRLYERLIAKDDRHRPMLKLWLLTYVFIAVQLSWTLRPFIGDPMRPTSFLRPDAWGNAYIAVFGIVRKLFGY